MKTIFKSKKFIAFTIVVVLGIGGYFYLSNKPSVVPVSSIEVENIVVQRTIAASGGVTGNSVAQLSFNAAGRVVALNVSEGDEVVQGQWLASLNQSVINQNIQAARDARDIALREQELFIDQNEDDKDLVGGEAAYDLRLKILNENISRAEAGYQAQLSTRSGYNIYAPYTGKVSEVNIVVGEQASPGVPVITLVNGEELHFEIFVDQEDFGLVKLGQDVTIELDSYDNKGFSGKIIELPTAVSSSTNNFKVKVGFKEFDPSEILLGMQGDARIIIETSSEPVSAVTFDVIYLDEDVPYIWTNDGGVAKRLNVETGIEGDIYTEVTTDLSNIELILPQIGTDLSEGDIIHLL